MEQKKAENIFTEELYYMFFLHIMDYQFTEN